MDWVDGDGEGCIKDMKVHVYCMLNMACSVKKKILLPSAVLVPTCNISLNKRYLKVGLHNHKTMVQSSQP